MLENHDLIRSDSIEIGKPAHPHEADEHDDRHGEKRHEDHPLEGSFESADAARGIDPLNRLRINSAREANE